MSEKISTKRKGEVGVYWAIAELLKEGCDIYVPVVDDRGIDLILRREIRGVVSFLELQFKARNGRDYGIEMKESSRRKNYWFVLFSKDGKYWVIPSQRMPKEMKFGKKNKAFVCKKPRSSVMRDEFKKEPYNKGLDSLIKWSRGKYVKFN